MPFPLPRAYRRQLQSEDERKIDRIVAEVGEAELPSTSKGATTGGDERRLRGLPAIGRGVRGAIALHGQDETETDYEPRSSDRATVVTYSTVNAAYCLAFV